MSVSKKRIKVYAAGFEVFKPNAENVFKIMKHEADKKNIELLCPLDAKATHAHDIFIGNTRLIRKSDAVIANVNAFRGLEPDSGTAWEIGFAYALNKQLVAYLHDARTVFAKTYEKLIGDMPAGPVDTKMVFPDGFQTEFFGMPTNLMLVVSCHTVEGSYKEALDQLITQMGLSS